MSLQDLPPELIQTVLSHLAWSSLDPFSRTSHRNHALATPHLSQHTLLLSANGRTLRPQAADVAAALRRATSVTVASPVPDESVNGNIRSRCPGCDMKDFGKEGETGEALIHEVLRNLRPNRLKEFTWLLGVCVQDDLLGPAGLLATQQRALESIRLATCYHRLGIRCQTRHMDLTPFLHLRSLSWTGIHRSQFRTVERALAASAPRLVELELDYLSSTANRDAGLEEDSFNTSSLTSFFLRTLAEGQEVLFPKLESLSLTNAVLETVRTNAFISALNARRLTSLTLKQCPGLTHFLARLLLHPGTGTLPLRRLEVNSFPREDDWDSRVAATIGDVVRQSPALEELAVYRLSGTASVPGTGLLLLDVRVPALRRVVVHEGSPLTGSLGGRRWEDVPRVLPRGREGDNLLSTSRLEFLGYAGPTEQVKTLLDELTPPEALTNLQVLHVRQDHEEVDKYYSRALGLARPDKGAQGRVNLWRMLTHPAYHFAAWAFATSKLPSLKLLAFGDFGSLDPAFRLLLCRSGDPDEPFRLVGERDGEVVCLLDGFLDSMVVGPSYSRPYLRASGASLGGNVWRAGLGRALARESGARGPTIPGEGGDGVGGDESESARVIPNLFRRYGSGHVWMSEDASRTGVSLQPTCSETTMPGTREEGTADEALPAKLR